METVILNRTKKNVVELTSKCNSCYTYKKINYYNIIGNNCYEQLRFFNTFYYGVGGYEDIVIPIYINNEKAFITIIRKEYDGKDPYE